MRQILPKRVGPRREISTEATRHDPLVSTSAQDGGARSIAAAKRAQATGQMRMFSDAATRLSVMSPSSAVEYMRTLPMLLLETYLVMEEKGLNRPSVLQYFPKSGDKVRQRYEQAFSVLSESPPATPSEATSPRTLTRDKSGRFVRGNQSAIAAT